MMSYLETSVCHFVGDLRGEAFGKAQEGKGNARPAFIKRTGLGGAGDTGDSQGTASRQHGGWVGLGGVGGDTGNRI